MSKKGIKESGVVSCTNLIIAGREEQSNRNSQNLLLKGFQCDKIKEDASQGKLEQ